MRKYFVTLSLTLGLFFSVSLGANAEEEVKPSPEVRFEERIEQMSSRQEERMAEKEIRYENSLAETLKRQASRLELISLYAPELYDLYAEAFADHKDVHEALYETRTNIQSDAFDTSLDGLTALKDEFFAQAEKDEITYREAAAQLQAYLLEQQASHKAARDDYQAAIAVLTAENEANKEAVKLLNADLRAAIEAQDYDEASDIITELYDYLLLHTAFDYNKLEILENMSTE